MSGVSIIIPNYNGQKLLAKHLPSVLEAARSNDELVIIDDCSTDNSWSWLLKEFSAEKISPAVTEAGSGSSFEGDIALGNWSHEKKKGSVQLLRNRTNQRFALSCNRAVELATQPLVFLLNSDVSPRPKTIGVLADHFTDQSLFAVGCLELEKSPDCAQPILGGKNALEFKRGMLIHRRSDNYQSGEMVWASGGSGMFDRQKWLMLEGFDADYSPAYWEDIDLSFRAKKNGWKVLFDEDAIVNHNHETTNTTEFGQKKMYIMSWQHANTFVQKNATFWQKLQYLLWQPYWWMKVPYFALQQLQFIFFLLIMLVAVVSRGYLLGQVPHGIAWDEAAIGYDGYSVATTGRDQWLKKLPISFRSFGDYKAPLAIYIDGIFTRFMGISALAIRLPFMLSSIAAILGMMALVYMLWSEWFIEQKVRLQEELKDREFPVLRPVTAALLAGGIMATSAWHIHFSRVAFESGMALCFLIWGMVGIVWLLWRKLEAKTWQKIMMGVFSAGCFAASLYTYHSSKIVAPLLIVTIAVLFRRKLVKYMPAVIVWCVLLAMMLLPLVYDSVRGQGADRFLQTNIFSKSHSVGEAAGTLVSHFFAHFSPSYLVGGYEPTPRHGDGKFGVLYLTEAFLGLVALVGFFASFFAPQFKKLRMPLGFVTLAVAWIVIGILPAAIGVDVPHSNRSLLALPGFILLALLGWQTIAVYFRRTLLAPAILGTLLLIHFMLFGAYMHHYFTTFAAESADAFSDGYKEAVEYAVKHEDDVDKIIFTSKYQQPLIYTLIGRKTNTYDYHNGALIKYEFRDSVNIGDLSRPHTLIIATPEELELMTTTDKKDVVYGSDGKVRFVMVQTR